MFRVKLRRLATRMLCLHIAQLSLLSTLSLSVLPLTASAQTGAIDTLPDDRRRTQQELEEAEKAAERARIQRLIEGGGDVAYSDVLADPDNIELNFRFAQTQIRQGNVRGASATLERILLIDPDRPEVRLLYAVVLFRLDNLQDAERELLAVRDLPMKPSLKREIEGFLSQIQQRRKRMRYNVLVSVGAQYDWNGNSAPRSNTRQVADSRFTITDADERHHERSYNGTLRVGFDYDLGLQRRHSVHSTVTAYRSEHVHEDQLELEALTWSVGPTLAYEPVTLDPQFSVTKVKLAHQRYLTVIRMENGASWQVTKKTALTALAGWEYQHFNSLHVSLTADERQGRQLDMKFGATHLLHPTIRIGAHVRYYDKNAQRNFNAYHRYEAGAEATVLLTGGRFLIASYTHLRDSYKQADPFAGSDSRNDWSGRARLLFGFPVSNLFGDLPDFLDGLTVTTSVERFHSVSNLPDYTYRNTTLTAAISRRWSF